MGFIPVELSMGFFQLVCICQIPLYSFWLIINCVLYCGLLIHLYITLITPSLTCHKRLEAQTAH